MKRNFGFSRGDIWAKYKPDGCKCNTLDERNRCYEMCNPIDPGVKKFFPWSLFLVMAVVLFLGAMKLAHGEEAIVVKKPSWSDWTCDNLRTYLATHTEAEARAQAALMHLPKWVIKRAEKCL